MTTTQLEPAPAARFLGRVGPDTRYVLSGFPLGLSTVVVCLTGLSLGLGLAIVWAGVPILLATLMMARGFADAERERSAEVLGGPAFQPHYRTTRAGVLTDSQSWRDLAHAVLRCVPSTIGFSAVMVWWAGMLGGVTWGLWGWALPAEPRILGFIDVPYSTAAAFYFVIGVLFAVTLPIVVRAAAVFEARFAQRLLTPGTTPGVHRS